MQKPGFTRLNFSVLLPDEKVDFILDSVVRLSRDAPNLANLYTADTNHAIFFPTETNASMAKKWMAS
jgi:hypothetical protein